MTLRFRLLLAFLLPAALLLGLGGFGAYRFARHILEDELGNSLSALAAATAANLSAERVMSLTEQDQDSRTYRSLSRQLNEVKTAAGVRRVLVFDRDGRARVDAGGGLPLLAQVPELTRDKGELEDVWSSRRTASLVLFEGNDGRLYKTGYAPLLKDNQVVGGVAVEGSAQFFGPMTTLARGSLVALVLTLLALAIAAVLTARALSAPLERLVASALRIGRGDLKTHVKREPTLEIGILSGELELMRDSLESRDRQLKMMLGGVAHEVKNPLGGIELFSGLLAEELRGKPGLEDASSHVAKVQRELDYLKRIVDDFLAYAREQKLAKVKFDGAALVLAAVEHLKGEASAREVTLEAKPSAGQVEGDVSLLTSALVNLVKNAVQAAPKGSVVKVSGEAAKGRYAIEVHDCGAGIAKEIQSRVFEPFFTTREKGTGLGLPLARKLAEAHGGTLTLSSVPGDTTFRLELPLV
ncbi:MAG: HAMP domain-containing sensor histidine kinase [Myxococcaceae bacterium]